MGVTWNKMVVVNQISSKTSKFNTLRPDPCVKHGRFLCFIRGLSLTQKGSSAYRCSCSLVSPTNAPSSISASLPFSKSPFEGASPSAPLGRNFTSSIGTFSFSPLIFPCASFIRSFSQSKNHRTLSASRKNRIRNRSQSTPRKYMYY